MPLIKSNSVLIAVGNDPVEYLTFLQNASFDIQTSKLNNKSIGNDFAYRNQFTYPEVKIDISYLQKINFFNERLMGFNILKNTTSGSSVFENYFNEYFIKNFIILMSDLSNVDLYDRIKNKLTSTLPTVVSNQLSLDNYSFSYRVGDFPIVNCSFSSNYFSAKNSSLDINGNVNLTSSDTNQPISLTSSALNDFFMQTNKTIDNTADNLILHMKNLWFSNTYSSVGNLGPNITTLLDGVIQSLDFSIDINRNKYYFFNNTNIPYVKKIISPIIGTLKITGISKDINLNNSLDSIFNSSNTFNITIDLGGKYDVILDYYQLIFENITVDSFNYSIDLNGFLNYTLSCSYQITPSSGFKINEINTRNLFSNTLQSMDGFFLIDKNQNVLIAK